MTERFDNQTYDELPYLVRAYVQTTPDRLATLAHLHRLVTPPVTSCRVLELGCAAGGNIIPLAQVLPESTFVGVDAAGSQILQGQATIAEFGLSNIKLEHLSLMEIDETWGQFDYIIAHGLYSWVPDDVRQHLLTVCKRNLAPSGVAFVSYNTYPGWNVLSAVRDALLYHTRTIYATRKRIAHARNLLDFLATAEGDYTVFPERPLKMAAQFFKEKIDGLGDDGDSYLLHELLEEVNEPVYFAEFVRQAEQVGLQYLSEAELSDMLTSAFPAQVSRAISSVASDPVEFGQYMDFLRDQTFRQTLLCHRGIVLDRDLDFEAVLEFYATSRAVPDPEPTGIPDTDVAYFRDEVHSVAFATEHQLTKSVLHTLVRLWPQAALLRDLVDAIRTEHAASAADIASEDDVQVLVANLLRAYCYSKNLVDLRSFAPSVATRLSDRPIASSLARIQARTRNLVTNLYHENVMLSQKERSLL